jgi:hypothetical protein
VAGNKAEALAAHQHGKALTAWMKQAGCARSTASQWADLCAVRIRKEVNPATGRQESWRSGHDVAILNDYRHQLGQDQKPSATVVSLATLGARARRWEPFSGGGTGIPGAAAAPAGWFARGR